MIAETPDLLGPGRDAATVDAGDPWPGLAPFGEADHGFFFGRETATEDLLRMVRRSRLSVLFSLSGLGKSSLVCAGLFPKLRVEGFLPVYLRPSFAPESPDIVAQLGRNLVEQATAAGVEAPVPGEGETLWELFHRQDADFWSRRNRRVIPVLAFDQFEEVFTLGRSHPGCQAFLTQLADLIEGRVPNAVKARLDAAPDEARRFGFRRHDYKILLALREDFLADLEGLRPAIPSLAHNRMRLTRMTGKEALAVVTGGGGQLVESAAAELIVRFVAGEGEGTGAAPLAELRVEPPLLSLVCRELNGRRSAKGLPQITGELLAGHRREILEDFYQRGTADLDPRVRAFVEERLLTATGFRNSVDWDDAIREPGVTAAALDRLIEQRLVRKQAVGKQQRIELTHDVLVGVVRASRDARRQREEAAAAEAASRLAEERERLARRQLRRARWTLALVVVLGIAALVFGGLSLWQEKRVRQALAVADLRWAAALLGQGQESEALPFLAAAVRHDPRSSAKGALLGLLLGRGWALPVAVLRHGDVVDAGDLSPDGRFAVSASRDRSARIWEIATGRVTVLSHPAEVAAARFSPDGRRVVTACRDGAARIWTVPAGAAVGRPLFHRGWVSVVEWSPDGGRVLTASLDGTARVWEAATGRPLVPPLAHGGEVIGASWSPDGRRVATTSRSGTARLWDAATGRAVGPPLVHEETVYSARFSPDGSRLVTASLDGAARIWDAETGGLLGLLRHGESIRVGWAEYSPDGRLVATSSADRTARLWDAATGAPVGVPMRHGARVRMVRFGPDGSFLLTASDDGTARLWSVPSGLPLGEPLRHGGWVYDVRPGRDGRHVLTTSEDGTARIWDASPRPAAPLVLRHRGAVLDADFDPAGARAVTASRDGTARLWNARTGAPAGQVLRHGAAVRTARFAPDGRRVLTASEDGTARLWDAATGAPVGKALRHQGPVTVALFSPDGRIVVTASRDHTARLWDGATGAALGAVLGHGEAVEAAAFSPDGRLVATASKDLTARIWRVPSGEAVGEPFPHARAVVGLAWSRTGDRLITASEDQEVRIWGLRAGSAAGPPLHLRHERVPHGAEVGPDGRWVMTYAGSQARLWDMATGKPLGEPLLHGSEVAYASLSLDGERAVTAGDDEDTPGDHLARVWDLRSGLPLGVPLPHGNALTAARFSRDGQRLITACADGSARIWFVPTGEAAGADELASLAEALAGSEIREGLLSPVLDGPRRIARLRKRAAEGSGDPAGNRSLLRWFLTPPEGRSASPLGGIRRSPK